MRSGVGGGGSGSYYKVGGGYRGVGLAPPPSVDDASNNAQRIGAIANKEEVKS